MEPEQNETQDYKQEFIASFEFYSQIIDSLQDYAIFTTDKELRINSWNIGSTKIFGYETQEVMGKHCELIFTEEDRNNGITQLKIEAALKDERVADSRWLVRKDGSLFYAYGVIFPLRGTDGELLGFVKILRDLTERRNSEEAIQKYIKELEELNTHLEELNTHKDSILAILSHDLRSPLSTIVAITDYLKSDFDTIEPVTIKQMIDILCKASTDELEMLDYLLEWARIKYASEVFTPTHIDLYPIANKVFDILNGVAAVKSNHLQNEIGENTIVFADRKMTLSILQNLVSNAIAHSTEGGNITVSARGIDQMILVQVKDTGIGMSKEFQEKIFKPQLKKLSKSRKEDKGGGIGLLLVKGFVEKQGGEICVDSIQGEGTSFYFSLPTEKPLEKVEIGAKIEFEESL